MIELGERVSKVEETLVAFMEQSARILAGIHEEVAEIRASNARTDRMLLELQQQAGKDRRLLRDAMAGLDRKFAEMREDFDRTSAEANQKFAKMREESDQKFAKMREESERKSVEANKWFSEWMEKADRERIEFNRRLAAATDAQGLLIENMVWPNLSRIASEVFRGGEVFFQGIRIKRRLPTDRSRLKELDLLAVGERDVLVCEAKSKVSAEKVIEFLNYLADFSEYFPDYAGKRLRPMVASVMIDPSVVTFMTSRGVLALGFGGETMDLLNPTVLD